MFGLENSLPAIRAIIGRSPDADLSLAKAAWHSVAGDLLADRTKVVGLERDMLRVAVESKVWQRNLLEHRTELLFKMNTLLGEKLINDIEFVEQPDLFANNRILRNTKETKVVSNELSDELAEKLEKIADPVLRAQISSVARAYSVRFGKIKDGCKKDR
ncbi:DciA family protein [Leptolyngbya sp. 7M]|uniref:DciA family protein n=1 Tax=Leptolyngbya sp. 7M TaxID=2812896 RepID=UPI001B8CC445|nr:DciA family protein [Leptolyngbya sp. 7M]QYO66619.1 DUF721 domain-containing protein [Leptolyngbya sp. 7M]